MSHVSYFDHVFGAFAKLAREYDAKLIVIFNPLPESMKSPEFEKFMDWKSINEGLKRVSTKNPDIIFAPIEFWPDEKFSTFSHVETPSSHESSHRVGEILTEIIGGKPPATRLRSKANSQPTKVEIDFRQPFCGYGWTDRASTTGEFPLQFIGPRNKAWVFTAFGPGSPYKLRSNYRSVTPGLVPHIELRVNEMPVAKLSSGSNGEDVHDEYLIPKEIVDMYGGWMKLEFALINTPEVSGKKSQRNVLFHNVTATPVLRRDQ